jgi:competence protein ComGF
MEAIDYLSYSVVKEGYAFKEDERERSKAIRDRYNEIKEDLDKIAKKTMYSYNGRNVVRYGNLEELKKKYSDVDLLIYADDGNLCFGGGVSGNEFAYFTD